MSPDGDPDDPVAAAAAEPTEYADRIGALAERMRADRVAFEPPASPPDEERAMAYLREGVGQAVKVYIDAHSGGNHARFPEAELDALHDAMNGWLELYAACYGVDIDASYPVRTAAELFIETHNVRDVAQLITGVPERR